MIQRIQIPRIFTEDELEALLEPASSKRYRAMWAILRWSGGRIGEVLSLGWQDLTVRARGLRTAPVESDISNKPLEWNGHHEPCATA